MILGPVLGRVVCTWLVLLEAVFSAYMKAKLDWWRDVSDLHKQTFSGSVAETLLVVLILHHLAMIFFFVFDPIIQLTTVLMKWYCLSI